MRLINININVLVLENAWYEPKQRKGKHGGKVSRSSKNVSSTISYRVICPSLSWEFFSPHGQLSSHNRPYHKPILKKKRESKESPKFVKEIVEMKWWVEGHTQENFPNSSRAPTKTPARPTMKAGSTPLGRWVMESLLNTIMLGPEDADVLKELPVFPPVRFAPFGCCPYWVWDPKTKGYNSPQ